MPTTRVLIAVKTYPTLSEKYDELVCTAGFLEDGTWIRIYPIPFRKLSYDKRYSKWQWIELDLVKNTSDFRKESFRPANIDNEIKIVGEIDTKNGWAQRKSIVLKHVRYNMAELIEEALKHIHILKANETEMEVLTGCKEPHEAALLIADWGVKEVLLTLGDKGSLIYAKGQFHEIPAYSALQIVDATGCGDTYMVGYLYMRNKGASYREAGCFAAAMCTIKLQTHGPFCGTEAEIRRIINPA